MRAHMIIIGRHLNKFIFYWVYNLNTCFPIQQC